MGHGEYTRRMPIPLFDIMRQCQSKLYQLLPEAVPDDVKLVERMHDLRQRGWTPQGTVVNFCDVDPEDSRSALFVTRQ